MNTHQQRKLGMWLDGKLRGKRIKVNDNRLMMVICIKRRPAFESRILSASKLTKMTNLEYDFKTITDNSPIDQVTFGFSPSIYHKLDQQTTNVDADKSKRLIPCFTRMAIRKSLTRKP